MSAPSPRRFTRHVSRLRPLLWRLPLLVFLAVGAITLWYLDGRLSGEYRSGAQAEAARTGALLENAIGQRLMILHSLRSLVADAHDGRDANRRMRAFTEQITGALPDVRRAYRLGGDGAYSASYPPATEDDLIASQSIGMRALADAVVRARDTRATSTSGLVPFRPDTLGLLFYDPIVRDGRVIGYVALGIGYAELLRNTLGRPTRSEYGYRIRDTTGRIIALSPRFPTRIAQFIDHSVALPGGDAWRLDVAVEPFQPMLARAALWVVGGLLLSLVILMMLRENARAERLSLHSTRLERLSRDLLDANVRLEERNRQVSDANRAKSRFLANVSHELRTPINAIMGYNALTLGGIYGALSSTQESALHRIDAAAKHLLSLVDDVLELSTIETGKVELVVGEVDVTRSIREVAQMVGASAAAKGVHVNLELPDEALIARTDGRHLRQIVLNLASNAIKYTAEGSVTLAARANADERGAVTIEVRDTGVGIARHDLTRIFEEFEQVRAGSRGDSMTRGTGLGLAVARKLARQLGGDVAAESELGRGSRFVLTLPSEPPMSSERSVEVTATAASPSERRDVEREIVVIDGDATMADDGAAMHASRERESPPERESRGVDDTSS